MTRGNYTYIALFKKEDGVYNVTVPDLEGVITFGESIPEAIEMAKDALEVWLLNAEDYGFEINKPRSFNELQHLADGEEDFLQYVTVDTVFARKKEDNKESFFIGLHCYNFSFSPHKVIISVYRS